jgi:biopolymer transport protein ExbD
MRFLVRKRRNAPTVIIVALVDVLIVLLIFLMVTTTFRQQPRIKLQLPQAASALKPGATTNEPPFVVSIDASNVIHTTTSTGDMPITLTNLTVLLQQKSASNPKFTLVIDADKNAHWDRVVGVMEVANYLKIKSVSASMASKDANKP